MTDLMKSTVGEGTLAGAVADVGGLPMDMAGKTGTTQNWSDAWTVGYSPYMTTAIWLGFDKPGNSLGLDNTGAVAAGPLWARYMKTVHKNLAPLKFPRPATGLYNMNVDAETGLLPSGEAGEKIITELFLEGTGPTEVSNMASFRKLRDEVLAQNIQGALDEVTGNGSQLNLDLNLDLSFDSAPAQPQKHHTGQLGGGAKRVSVSTLPIPVYRPGSRISGLSKTTLLMPRPT